MLVRMPFLAESDSVPVILVRILVAKLLMQGKEGWTGNLKNVNIVLPLNCE